MLTQQTNKVRVTLIKQNETSSNKMYYQKYITSLFTMLDYNVHSVYKHKII